MTCKENDDDEETTRMDTPGISTDSRTASTRKLDPSARRRDIAKLRDILSTLCNFVWSSHLRPGEHLWSIPADPERDFDCILSDAFDELEDWREKVGALFGEFSPQTIREYIEAERAEATYQARDIRKVTRFEVIRETGRSFVRYQVHVELSFQDEGRTLKVFLRDREGSRIPLRADTPPAGDAIDPQVASQESGPRAQESSSDLKLAQLREGLQQLEVEFRSKGETEMAIALDKDMHAAAGVAAIRLHCATRLAALLAASKT